MDKSSVQGIHKVWPLLYIHTYIHTTNYATVPSALTLADGMATQASEEMRTPDCGVNVSQVTENVKFDVSMSRTAILPSANLYVY